MPNFNMSVSTFPLTVIGIPIATVCPPAIGSAVSNLSFATNVVSASTEAFPLMSLPTTSLIASSITIASAKLPDGSMTAYSSLIRREIEEEAAPAVPFILPNGNTAIHFENDHSIDPTVARVVVGSGGCQTLYTPTTTAICSTVVSPIGLPPITVTDCSQYVTFSSETAYTCAPTSEFTPLAASSNDGANPTYNPLGASITTPASASSSATPSSDLTGSFVGGGVGPLEVASSTGTAATLDLPTTSAFPTSSDEGSGSEPTLFRRDLIYTSPSIADLPISLPRQLWPENPPSKRQVSVVVRKRQVDLDDSFNITIVRDVDNPGSADVSVESSISDAQTMPQSISMSFSENTGITMTPAVSEMGALSQDTDMTTQNDIGMSAYPTAMDTASLPQPTVGDIIATVPTPSDPSIPVASDVTTPALSDVDTPAMSVPYVTSIPEVSAAMTSSFFMTSDSNAAIVPSMDATDLPVHAVQLSPPQPTRYYAAPWYQLTGAFGAVPTNVKGITCYGGVEPPESCVDPEADAEPCGCDIDEEIWRVISLTRMSIGTSVVSYDGPVVVTASGQTLTTSVSFTETITTTREIVAGGIVKSTILASSSGEDATVYATETSFPSVTMTMLPGDGMFGNITASMTVSGQGSSSVVDAAAPQDAPASIASPISLPTTELPDISESSARDTGIDGTTFVTSIVATETVTMTPSGAVAATSIPEPFLAKPTVEPIPDMTENPPSSAETSAFDVASLAGRDN